MNQLDETKRRKINQKIIDAAGSRFVPPRTSFSPEEAKTLFYPPITLNTKEPEKEESRFTNDAAIGSSFNAYYASLTQHALDLGQFPYDIVCRLWRPSEYRAKRHDPHLHSDCRG